MFYDKLLCVPLLNLTVRALDRASDGMGRWFTLKPFSEWTPRKLNFGFMGIWAAFFAFMVVSGFMRDTHPGTNPALWEQSCSSGNSRSCGVLARMLDNLCQRNSGESCFRLGTLLSEGKQLTRSPIGAARSLAKACDLGSQGACGSLLGLLQSDGETVLQQPCNQGDATTCFMLGSMYALGQSVSRSPERAASLYQQSCGMGFVRACGMLGESHITGDGVPRDMTKARQILERACTAGYGPACFNAGIIHREGIETPKNLPLAQALFRQGCDRGFQNACQALEPAGSVPNK